MQSLRRTLRIVLVATVLLVGTLALALVATQTSWFKDWIRRYAIRQAAQVIDGQLAIGRIEGDLWSGVQLHDVRVDHRGLSVIALQALELHYSLLDVVRQGAVVRNVRLVAPTVTLRRAEEGWNVLSLFVARASDGPEGESPKVLVNRFQIENGTVTIDDPTCPAGAAGCPPARIERLNATGRVSWGGQAWQVSLPDLSLVTATPDLTLSRLVLDVEGTPTTVNVKDLRATTERSTVTLAGWVRQLTTAPNLDVRLTADRLALGEIGAFVPQLAGHPLTPQVELQARGPLDALAVDLRSTSDAGTVESAIVADVQAPSYGVQGDVGVQRVNAAQLLNDSSIPTDLTAKVRLDLTGADLPSLAGEASVVASKSSALNYELDELKATARIDKSTATINASGRALGASMSAEGSISPITATLRDLAYDFRGQLRDVNLLRLPANLGIPSVATNIGGSYVMRGKGSDVGAQVTFVQSTVAGAFIDSGTRAGVEVRGQDVRYEARGRVSEVDPQAFGRLFDIEALKADAYEGRIAGTLDVRGQGTSLKTLIGQGAITLEPSRLGTTEISSLNVSAEVQRGAVKAHVTGDVQNLQLDTLTGRSELNEPISATVDANIGVQDMAGPLSLEVVAVDGRVTIAPGAIAGFAHEGLTADAQLLNGRGVLRHATLRSNSVDVDASGPIALDAGGESRIDYAVDVKDAAALAQLAGTSGVAGTSRLEGTLTGNLQRLQTRGTLSGKDLVFTDTGSVDQLRATFDASIDDLKIDQSRGVINLEAAGVDARGTLVDTLALDASYADRSIDFESALVQRDRSVTAGGTLTLKTDVQDVILRKLGLQGEGLSWTLIPDRPARVIHQGGIVTIQDLRLESGTQRLGLNGAVRLPTDSAPLEVADLSVEATQIDLAPLVKIAAPERALGGRMDATVKVSGSLDAPRMTGQVKITDGSVETYKFQSLHSKVDVADRRAAVDARLQQDASSWFTVSGSLPLTPLTGNADTQGSADEHLDLVVKSSPIDLAALQGVTSTVDQVQGQIQADVKVGGTLSRPALDGLVTLTNGAFHVAPLDMTYAGAEMHVRLATPVITIESARLRDSSGNPFEITGTVTLADENREVGDVDLQVRAHQFEVLDNDLGDIDLTADVKMSGTPAAPVVRGELTLTDARIEIDRVLNRLNGIETDQEPYGDWVYEPPERPAAQGVLSSATSTSEPAATTVDAASVTPQSPEISAQPSTGADRQTGLFDRATLDIRLRVPDNLVLRGDDVRLEADSLSLGEMNLIVGADLHTTKVPAEPVLIVGAINTVRGHYEFHGRRFEFLRDGTIRFQGPDPTDPSLDVKAARDVSGVEARVGITGTAQKPILKLSSVPPLDEADVLALIIFDRPIDQLGEGEKTTVAQQAGALLGDRITGSLAASLRDVLDVDLLEIDAFDAQGGPTLTLGNQIGERVFVRFRQQVGTQDLSQLLLEYQLVQNLRLQTSVSQGARSDRSPGRRVERSGIDVLYILRY